MKNKRERKKRWKRKLERERKHPNDFFSKRDRGMHLFKPQNNYLDINEPHRLILEGSRRFDFSVLIRSTNICSTLNQLQLFTGNLSGLRIWIFSSLKCLEFRPLRRSKVGIWKLEKLQNGAFRIPNAEPLTPTENRMFQKLLKLTGTLPGISLRIRLSSESSPNTQTLPTSLKPQSRTTISILIVL